MLARNPQSRIQPDCSQCSLPQVVLMRSRVSSAVLHEQMELVWAGKVFPCFLVLHLVWNPLLQLHTYLTVPSRLPVFVGAGIGDSVCS